MSAAALSALMFPDVDPVAFRLGPVALRWYGLAYLLAFAVGYAVLRYLSRRQMLRVAPDLLGELVAWLAAGVVVGGRAGWWVFYHRAGGADEPWYEPFALWHGGMSFHGGLVGVCVALLLWSRWRRVPLWNVADALALVVPAGLFFGRIANFVNAELVGRPTGLPWGVVFPGDTIARHPSQLYEALLEGPLLLVALWAAHRRFRRRPHHGQVAALFLVLYGVVRFGVEFTRQPDEQLGFVALGWLTMGQVLSVLLTVGGVLVWLLRSADHGRDGTGVEQDRLLRGVAPR